MNSLKVGIKMTMKKAIVTFNDQLAGQQIIIGNEKPECRETYILRTNN